MVILDILEGFQLYLRNLPPSGVSKVSAWIISGSVLLYLCAPHTGDSASDTAKTATETMRNSYINSLAAAGHVRP